MTFGIDGDGNRGYYGADGSLIPFSGKLSNTNGFVFMRNLGFDELNLIGTGTKNANYSCTQANQTQNTYGYFVSSKKINLSKLEKNKLMFTIGDTGNPNEVCYTHHIAINHNGESGYIGFGKFSGQNNHVVFLADNPITPNVIRTLYTYTGWQIGTISQMILY